MRAPIIIAGLACIAATVAALAAGPPQTLTGAAAYGDWKQDAPGVIRKITPADLPAPFATGSTRESASIVKPPSGAHLTTLPSFSATIFADHLQNPREIKVAPNGDVFVAESRADRVRVLRAGGEGKAKENGIFASGLDSPFGVAFYPPGPDPQYVYIANTTSIVRFPYKTGDLKAAGPPETIVPSLVDSGSGHWTRDIVFSPDGRHMFVSVGSGSNDGGDMSKAPPEGWVASHPLGAAWGNEAGRADVLEFDPDGRNGRIFATGIRNCVSMALEPQTHDLWCATNERDGLGDNLPPDYATRVREGGFYGWPWYYIGDHEDPRHKGERPDLAGKVTVPDVLIQPHSAPLGMTFYNGAMFPPEYRGSAFVALHGSWNRHQRTGYKIVCAILEDGVPTGEYEDFVTGFVTEDGSVWGRPVGVAVAKDGALLFSEDGNGTIWRVGYSGQHAASQ
ncbi:MAG: sorbosone dehydrogenase family protein [Stellaceae bacterium]